MDLSLTVRNPGGHTAAPPKINAIYQLSKGLVRLSEYDFPAVLNSTTRAYFSSLSLIEDGPLAADMKAVSASQPDTAAIRRLSTIPLYNAVLRTTCVATMLEGGHAVNALPQTAIAKINCRVLPGQRQEAIVRQIESVLQDSQIEVKVIDTLRFVGETQMNDQLLTAVRKVTNRLWPGVIIVPFMQRGATDGSYLASFGIPTFGNAGIFFDIMENRAHGKDERILIRSFYEGLEYEYELIKILGKNYS